MRETKATSQSKLTLALRCATPAPHKRVLAVLADWPVRHGFEREERSRLIRDCAHRVVKVWGGRWLNSDTLDLEGTRA
ncbi:hypothetical protein [Caballeronia sp. INSB1]|jgi:hypothetical protein|uniref:hypothetical protein n=1 Tax=Caballeronia sp. INSB1 TaxID=2921751 RepID=UPI002032C103|nr:hypothetical protein [Caballeronia sp. INSB1]